MKCFQNLSQACLKWWEQFFTTVLWALGFDSYQTQLTLTGKGFLACHKIRRNTQNGTAHFWLQCTLSSCTHFAPRVTVGWVLWPPGARGLQIFMSASVVTMLFSQRVALYQCWLVSQHGTGIRNCFARKLAVNEMLPKLEPSLPEMMRTVFHDGLMSSWIWFLPNSAHSWCDLEFMCFCLHIWDESIPAALFVRSLVSWLLWVSSNIRWIFVVKLKPTVLGYHMVPVCYANPWIKIETSDTSMFGFLGSLPQAELALEVKAADAGHGNDWVEQSLQWRAGPDGPGHAALRSRMIQVGSTALPSRDWMSWVGHKHYCRQLW